MLIKKIINRLKIIVKRNKLSKINVFLHKKSIIDIDTHFEGHSKVNDNCIIINCLIGRGTFISSNSSLYHAKIGRFCSIAPDVQCVIGNHPSHTFVSTHPAFFSLKKQAGFTFTKFQKFEEFIYLKNQKEYMYEIGNDVWIGQGTKLLNGIKIGNGAIIAAGSIVVKDVPSYSIVGGTPAKIIKMRFSQTQIDYLESFKWWDKSNSWLKAHCDFFDDIELFQNKNQI